MDKVISGNFNEAVKQGSDWVMGFNPEALIQSTEVAMNWRRLKKGDNKLTPFANKVSKTITVLITGKISVKFTDDNTEVILQNEGDFVFSPPGRLHTREVLEDSLTISLRWPAIEGDQINPSTTT